MGATPDTSRIDYRLSQNDGTNPPIDLVVSFEATPRNYVAVDAGAEVAMRALITFLEARYPLGPVGTERVYQTRRVEADWHTQPMPEPPEDPPAPTLPPIQPPALGD
ncbi:hypothetical protein [Streptomyces griseus]|uniref:hypothetical protein n=1 Tax=Streptomyces griseus TaxID=1911 RepID=UPI0033BCAD5B